MTEADPLPVALTIAGSDSGGGAGIQADLSTFRALGTFGTSAITCLTAQNPDGVLGVEAVAPEMVALQIKAVREGYPIAAAKTGMLYSAPIIRAVVAAVSEFGIRNLVVDPVMVATSGSKLLRDDAIQALCDELLPRALVVTPNADEAEILCGHPVTTPDELRAAAREIAGKWGIACAAKGGHLSNAECGMRNPPKGLRPLRRAGAESWEARGKQGTSRGTGQTGSAEVLDVLCVDGELHEFAGSRVDAAETHGTGCTFSAAMTALLARGLPLVEACRGAKEFVGRALAQSRPVGTHSPLNW